MHKKLIETNYSDPIAMKAMMDALRNNDAKEHIKKLLEQQKLWDRVFNYAAVALIGVACGYAWCWFALN